MPIVVNMGKARAIHMAHIRKVRNQELAALDVPFMRSIESGDNVERQRITALKQALRDIPQTFDLHTRDDTPAELRARWPELLPEV